MKRRKLENLTIRELESVANYPNGTIQYFTRQFNNKDNLADYEIILYDNQFDQYIGHYDCRQELIKAIEDIDFDDVVSSRYDNDLVFLEMLDKFDLDLEYYKKAIKKYGHWGNEE